jgi:NTP pyrophosphatase (non-canonical NTP hydrolase)
MNNDIDLLWVQFRYWIQRDVKVALDIKEKIRKIQCARWKAYK